jgi:hypothetical protein
MFANHSLFSIFLLFAILLISLSFSSYTIETQEHFSNAESMGRAIISSKKV